MTGIKTQIFQKDKATSIKGIKLDMYIIITPQTITYTVELKTPHSDTHSYKTMCCTKALLF